jgi:hypothetical protein
VVLPGAEVVDGGRIPAAQFAHLWAHRAVLLQYQLLLHLEEHLRQAELLNGLQLLKATALRRLRPQRLRPRQPSNRRRSKAP